MLWTFARPVAIRLAEMWEVDAEVETPADSASVWALWADAARWRDWNEQIATAELDGPFAVGSTARIRFKRRPRALRFTITALDPGRRFVDETRLPGARLGHEHRLQRDGSTTRIGHRLYFDGPAERVYALLMGRQMKAAVRRFGERERELALNRRAESSG